MYWSMPQGGTTGAMIGASTAASTSIIATGGSAHTKGSWVELIASTAYNMSGFILQLDFAANSTNRDMLVDIGIGGSGSEQVLIENILASFDLGSSHTYDFRLPIRAGTRIAARCQSNAARPVGVQICPKYTGFYQMPGYGRATTYGANTTDSGGVQIDPGGTINTKGSYSEITAATTNRIRGLHACFGTQFNADMTTGSFLVDIAVGAGGSEQNIIENMHVAASNGETLDAMGGVLDVNIPAGTRLSARCQSSINDATDRLIDIVIIGVD
jgi:hypothetical protein